MTRQRLLLAFAACALAGTIACVSSASESDDDGRGRRRASPEVIARGKGLYKNTCAPCHGDGGKGDGPASKIFKPPPRDHTDATYMDTLTDEDVGKTIQMGGAMKGKPSMPSNPQIRGEDLAALIAYVRSLSQHDK